MSGRIWGLFCYCVVVGFLATAPVATGQTKRSGMQRKILDTVESQVLPAYYMGDTLRLLRLLSHATKRLDADELVTVDATLASAGLPSAGEIMLTSRLAMVRQKQTDGLPPPHLREILLVIPVLRDQSRDILAQAKNHASMRDPLPSPHQLEGYQRLFWDIHVMENRLRTARVMCDYGATLVDRGGKSSKLHGLEDAQRQLLDVNFRATADELDDVYRELQQRRMELRVGRLDLAANVLDASDAFMERLQAAFVVDLDGELIMKFLENLDESNHVTRQGLLNPELPAVVAQQTEQAREAAGDLIPKSRLFFEGVHWWLRGRYGRGSDGAGLLKSPLALKDPRALFGLVMPEQFPAPREKHVQATEESNGTIGDYDQSDEEIRPDYDRRHHYNWMFEYRRLQKSSESQTTTVGDRDRQITQRTRLSTFY